jgi:antitoxin component YwqK of YwqJK toxin-antitoxin module
MGLGFGVLKQMSDTFKYNRDLLGKKKALKEIYKDEIMKRPTTSENQDLELVRLRVEGALRRNRTHELFAKVVAVLSLSALLGGIVWASIAIDFTPAKRKKYEDKSKLFRTKMYDHSKELKLKADYFPGGPKASETLIKDGLRHQNSESYYESGEQFRSALYYYDTLVNDIYFYKSGDTIRNFPAVYDQEVHRITLHDNTGRKKIEFDLYDGKIIQGTYMEHAVDK